MNEGNCAGCGDALHTKVRVTVHPVTGWDKDGNPIRGLEKDVHACGDCVAKGEDIGAAIGVKKPAAAKS
jgi:hypothetical protein